MGLPTQVTHFGLVGVATGVSVLLAAYAGRHREEPGAPAFAALMGFIAIWTGTYGLSTLVADPGWRLVMERVQWFGAAFAPVALLVFALTYTGHDTLVSWRTAAGIAVPPAMATVLVWLNPGEVMYAGYTVKAHDGIVLIGMNWTAGFYVHVVYGYALVAVAAALLLRLVVVSDYLYADQSALLLVGIAAPFVGSVYDFFGPNGVLVGEMTPLAFAVTGVTFGYALFRGRLLDLVPATRQLGRNAAIGQLEDGVVIVDTDRRIVYCNVAAGDLLDREPADAVGSAVDEVLAVETVDFTAEDALAEIERGERVYEVRTSPIEGRQGRLIGHTLLLTDVTARKRRVRRLATQRDELERVNELNAIVRGVNQALVGADDRTEIANAVCARLAESGLYAAACMADTATWRGDGDRWTTAGDAGEPPRHGALEPVGGGSPARPVVEADGGPVERGWIVAPVTYGATVFGGIGVRTERESVSARERRVLGELGELVGHALDAVERRQLLTADSVVELELENEDGTLAELSAAVDCTVEMEGIVPAGDDRVSLYLVAADASPELLRDELAALTAGSVRLVGDGSAGSVVEWTAGPDSLPSVLDRQSGRIDRIEAGGGRSTYELTVPSDGAVRTALEAARRSYPETTMVAKRTRDRSFGDDGALPAERDAELTERQREVLEAAYRAGYFAWPRESTAEEVAETLDIAPATLHGHLRKAERAVFERVVDGSE